MKVPAWGNSLGLRIPKAYAAELGVGSGSEMEVKVEALLADITADNQHHETDWGVTCGVEEW